MKIFLVSQLYNRPLMSLLLEGQAPNVLLTFADDGMREKLTMEGWHEPMFPPFFRPPKERANDHLPGPQPE